MTNFSQISRPNRTNFFESPVIPGFYRLIPKVFSLLGILLVFFACPEARAELSVQGLDLEQASNRDFFRHFNFRIVGHMVTGDGYTQLLFKRPKDGPDRSSVKLYVTLDGEDRIRRMSLCLDRRFIDSPKQGMFARDEAKSFIQAAVSDSEYDQVRPLANEIFFRQNLTKISVDAEKKEVGTSGVTVFKVGSGELAPGDIIIIAESDNLPKLPEEPSRLYKCFTGDEPEGEVELSESLVRFENRDLNGLKTLEISIMPRQDAKDLANLELDFNNLPLRRP